ncbi:MAG: DUF5662 family protein [Lachnospiraceae bacterium]
MHIWKHFKTITEHKLLVMQGCFKVGLYKQGLLHDLSKYMPSEFFVGAKYYQGTRSPNNAEREAKGYSAAWLHHKGRNKHHYEYWVDYSTTQIKGSIPVPMPTKYIIEMFMDRIAASKVYNKGHYTDSDPLNYYNHGSKYALMHEDTRAQLESLLQMLSNSGETVTFAYIRHMIK